MFCNLSLRIVRCVKPHNFKPVFYRSVGESRQTRFRPSEPNIPDDIKTDWIGPPDPASNMRTVKFHIPKDETCAEKHYRILREDTHNWNHEFWAKHNRNFMQEKEAFIRQKAAELTQSSSKSDEALTSDQLSEFYRKFLDDNYLLHRQYNKDWYRRNIAMLWPAVKVKLQRAFRRRKP